MAANRLMRKRLRRKMTATAKVKEIKRLQAKPVVKNVDIEAIKESFKSKK